MTSKIKVNILADGGDNSIITSDGAGSFTASSSLASSVQSVGGIQNTPAFDTQLTSSQTISDNTNTKLNFDNVLIDTDSAFDTSNKRFTVPSGKGGKYLIYFTAISADNGDAVLISYNYAIYKNGTNVKRSYTNFTNNYVDSGEGTLSAILDLSAGDYIEIYGTVNTTGASPNIFGGIYSTFGGMRLIGA